MRERGARGLRGLHLRRQHQPETELAEKHAAMSETQPVAAASDTHCIAAASNTVTASTQGAMFIAGFAYYEVGRFGGGNQDTAYLVLLTGALVSAILAAAVGGLFSCRLAVCDAASVRCGAAFARNGVWVVRATYRYYLLAVTLYLASLARAGYQYYQPGAPRLVPTAFACAALAAFVRGYRIVIETYSALESISVAAAKQGRAGESLDCPRATHLHQQGQAISTLMIFVMSFTQAGVTRFAPNPPSMTDMLETSESAWLGMSLQAGVYLVSASLAFSCAAFAVFTSCVTLIFLYDLEGADRKELFATQTEQVWRCVQLASLVALLSFNVSFATVGWGVGYASCRSIPTVIGYFSLLVQCAVALTLLHAALTEPSTGGDDLDDEDFSTLKEAVEAKLQTVALRSSITAGYVWYHLATFATDVGNYETLGVYYLTVHALAFGLGLTSCTVAHVTSICVANAHQDSRLKMARTAQVISQVVGVFYWLSLVCFILGFGLIGPVKRNTQATVWLAALALIGLVLAVVSVRQRLQHKTAVASGGNTNSPDNCNCRAQNDQLADQAFQSSGSFGYFCALFLNAPSTPGNEPSIVIGLVDSVSTTALGQHLPLLYCWMMGGSFVAAVCLVALSTMLTISGTQQGAWSGAVFRGLHGYAITSFQVGFILLGAQGQTVGYFALLCGGGSLVLLVSVLSRVLLPRVLQPHSHTVQLSQPGWKQLISAFRYERTSFSVADPRLPGCPVTRVSDGFLSLTGYSRPDVLGKNCRFLQGPKTDRATVARLRQALDGGEDVAVKMLNYKKDGSEFWNLLQLEHVRDRHGVTTQIIGRQMDITEDMQSILGNRAQSVHSGAISSPRAAVNWRRLRTSFVDRVVTDGSEVNAQLQFGAAVKQLQQLQQESCFVASNVFFELLFARAVQVDCWSHAIFLGGALLTFCLAACVHMVSSTTLVYTAAHSALDSSTAAVRATRQVAVVAMVLMLCCMLCWMSSVGASAMVKCTLRSNSPTCARGVLLKQSAGCTDHQARCVWSRYPAHWRVSASCAGYGLVALVLHFVQISAVERRHAMPTKPAPGGQTWKSALEEAACSLLRAQTDAVATHRLWWRLAAGYLACVFGAELWACACAGVVAA